MLRRADVCMCMCVSPCESNFTGVPIRRGWRQMLMFVPACSCRCAALVTQKSVFQSAALQRHWCGGWCWLRRIVRGP